MEELNYKYKVLIVDDVINNFTYLMKVLQKLNCCVIYAVNGKEAINICKQTNDINLIFMDLNLPIIDGFEATRIIKEFRKDIPIIAITAYSSGENRKRAKQAGCSDYVVKPVFKIQIENIINKYKKVLKKDQLVSDSLGVIKYL